MMKKRKDEIARIRIRTNWERRAKNSKHHFCTHSQLHMQTYTPARLHSCTPAPMHACTHARLHAFTLTELLTVVAIIAILMGLIVAFYGPSQEQRKVFECQNRLQVIHRALRLYMLDWDGFPASPYDSLNNDVVDEAKGGNCCYFDEDPKDGTDNDNDGKVDEDDIDTRVGGLLALGGYLRSHRTLVCPSDLSPKAQDLNPNYSSYQGCDTGTGFDPSCSQGVPTYAITRFPTNHPCHPSNILAKLVNPNLPLNCDDPDAMRQLGVRNVSPYFPTPQMPSDDTVVTWCVHHRYVPNTTSPNYVKGGIPADVVLYFDGSVRIQTMKSPILNWRRKPTDP
ncbi:MAG: type II secretion system GspH family protein [Armatimonadetes bacterium]|nr:type II secretion system GspH family protein [Armatimonadota bacterium]